MQITFEIPEEFATQLIPPGTSPTRATLESLAIDGYQTERLNEFQLQRILGLETRLEVHALLKQHHIPLLYSQEDLEQDRQTLSTLLGESIRPLRIAG